LHQSFGAAAIHGRLEAMVRIRVPSVLKVLVVIILCLFVWVRRQPAYDSFVHQISDLDLSLQLPRTGLNITEASDHFGYYSSKAAKDFCRYHGWPTFTPQAPTGQRKVYDLFMVNSELDWMEIRLNTTYDYVDYFIVVESPKTFQGGKKPLTIKANWDKFARYHDKLIYHQLVLPEGFNPPRAWDYEDLQRDAMYLQVFPKLKGRQKPVYGDAIIVADVDEITRPEALLVLRTCEFPRRLTLRSRFFYYSFQFLHRGEEWAHPQATFYQGWRTILPVNLRNGDGGIKLLYDMEKGNLWNAGWHCSSCFATIDQFLNKLSSFSHKWMNADIYRSRERVARHVREGKDLWEREGEIYDRIDDNQDVPHLLLDESDRFRYLLNRDGPTAGFTDYP
jgi:beta-1,4-mannosyl-glycoprotein beta-1,4-N-acetylglucosaminyltransferase